jgi:putative PIN family toxin of toxin-antitoxin system
VRVVLDSSVLVAAHISRAGVCAELFEEVLERHELIVSPFILDEVRRILSDKFGFPGELVRQLLRSVRDAAESVTPADVPTGACRDPEDAPILGTAVAGAAALLVTVDKDLLALERYGDIRIVNPGGYWHFTRAWFKRLVETSGHELGRHR